MKKLLLVLGFVFTVMTVHAISICKGTGGGTGSADFPADKTFVMTIKTPADKTFSFQISASGNYKVDWGDGTAVEKITKSDTVLTKYSHTYPAVSTNYTAKLSGLATGYNSDSYTPAITFYSANPQANLTGIAGNLGYIFPVVDNSKTTGKPRFYSSFSGCKKITGSIPENLFAGINGAPAQNMFQSTFNGCTGLTGAIPGNLFAGIIGTTADSMFYGTFSGCTGLTSISGALFSGISGAPALNMFSSTFYSCTGLTNIPIGLFGNVSGTAQWGMFEGTFQVCTSLTGQSALMPDGTTHLYEKWSSATTSNVGGMYWNTTGLADYASIPAAWK
jgi:hypothetical protein